MSGVLRCPTCRSPWQGVVICPRCGSDLAAVMRVAHRAWELREAARRALGADDRAADALALARAAYRLHATSWGERLLGLALLATRQMAHARSSRTVIGHDPDALDGATDTAPMGSGTTAEPTDLPAPNG